MAVHQLLLRGMLVGMIAGLLAFGFARTFGEPSVERAIAFEEASAHQHHHDAGAATEPEEPELVSRPVQQNIGLPFGQIVYGGAIGGLFALLFAFAYGRFGRMPPKATAAILAWLCFVAIFAVPYLKYPANPPAVGQPGTIGIRTGLYFVMIGISIVAMMTSFSLKRLIQPRLGTWNATLVGALSFIALVALAGALMPTIDEVPATFPAATLWQFRLATLGIQAILWSTIGLLFGVLTERSLRA